VVLDPKDYGAWLDPGRPGAQALLKPCPSEWLEAVPVSTRVNSPANDDSSVLEPVGGPVAAQGALL
jgi:putative SOS response-associated peptidase YedK